jgi:hypothetical protein
MHHCIIALILSFDFRFNSVTFADDLGDDSIVLDRDRGVNVHRCCLAGGTNNVDPAALS